MATKDSEILDAHDTIDVTAISFLYMGEDCNFYVSLLYDISRYFYHLHSHFLSWFMVSHPQHLSKGALVDWIQNLVAICNVVSQLILIEFAV